MVSSGELAKLNLFPEGFVPDPAPLQAAHEMRQRISPNAMAKVHMRPILCVHVQRLEIIAKRLVSQQPMGVKPHAASLLRHLKICVRHSFFLQQGGSCLATRQRYPIELRSC